MLTVVAFCCGEISERNGIAGNAANVSRMKTNQVLIVIGCLRPALAARAWEDISYGGRQSADGAELQLEVGPNTTLDGLIKIQHICFQSDTKSIKPCQFHLCCATSATMFHGL